MTKGNQEALELDPETGPGSQTGSAVSAPSGVQQTGMRELARAWLSLQCSMLSGVHRAVVLLGTAGSENSQPVALWPEDSEIYPALLDAARQAVHARRPQLYTGAAASASEPAYDVVACPLPAGSMAGAVAVEMSPRPEKNRQASLRVLQWGAAWFEMLLTQEANPFEHRLLTVVDVIAKGLEQEEFGGAAMAVATELTNRLGCDRVSLGFIDGRGIRIEAISQIVQIDDKTNLVRALDSAMHEALEQDGSIVFPESIDDRSGPNAAHTELARGFGANAICTVPMSHDGRAVGVMVLERMRKQPFDSELRSLCEYLASLMGPILDFKRRAQRPLTAKIAAALRERWSRSRANGQLAWKPVVLLLCVLAIGIVAYGETVYRVDAEAQLQGTVQRVVIAPFDGFLAEAPLRAGDLVEEGQIMCRLEDRELRLEHTSLSGDKAKLTKEYREALATHDRSQISVLKAKLDQADAKLALVEEKLRRTRVRSPLHGVVVSGDHTQALGAPVQRGQVLFEVAPLDEYRIVLNVDEREIAAVRTGQTGKLILAGLPNEVHNFTVERVTPISFAHEGQNLFRVEARLMEQGEQLRPGMRGVGKIETETRRRGWIWSHSIVDWLRMRWWSWWG